MACTPAKDQFDRTERLPGQNVSTGEGVRKGAEKSGSHKGRYADGRGSGEQKKKELVRSEEKEKSW